MSEAPDKLSSLTIDQQNKLRALSRKARNEIISNSSDKAVIQVLNKYASSANTLNLPKFSGRAWLTLCIQIIDKEIKRG